MDETNCQHLNGRNGRARDEQSGPTDSPRQCPDAAVNNRIDCLKVLALTLLRQIESLENTTGSGSDFDLGMETRRFESEIIRSALIKTGGRQRQAARLLGMKATTFNTKIRRYGIKLNENTVVDENESATPGESSTRFMPVESLRPEGL